MQNFFIVIFISILIMPALGQNKTSKGMEVGLAGGYRNIRFHDERLNYFNYKGYTFHDLSALYSSIKEQSSINFHLGYNDSQLFPDHIKTGYYEYNYIDNNELNLSITWLKSLKWHSPNIVFKAGFGNSIIWNRSTEFYQSNLYEGALGYKKSFLLSLLNISPTLEAAYTCGNHLLSIGGSYSILSLNARPDDVYVRQTNAKGSSVWTLQWFDSHKDAFLISGYQYRVCQSWKVSINYVFCNRNNKGADQYQSVTQSVVAGMIKTF